MLGFMEACMFTNFACPSMNMIVAAFSGFCACWLVCRHRDLSLHGGVVIGPEPPRME